MQFPSWATMIAVFFMQLAVLLFIATVMILIRKKIMPHKRLKVVPVDLWPPFILFFIHQLSASAASGSVIPQIVIIWMTISLVALLWQILTDKKMTFRRFFVLFWRLSDLVLLVSWICTFVYMIIQAG
ncbi:MAG: DUF3397 domain-containing protein [Lentilactobacillus buchneri]|jgi:hypothetical protein|nr:DUF3397 domain-containing protein [Lentilactobacillus buchneri]MCI2019917.1 DUF3397 domain-containing protein [Lentilactobacillus buchneri]MCI2028234.1 DUF3397 domain-containing protein [Lentilactobacillus buchneri]